MTKVIFETASLADAAKKAARIAPAKGQAFDKAAGMVLDFAPDVSMVRATNLEIFYTEWVDPLKVEGDRAVWRVPAQLFASVLGSLPIGSGREVSLEQEGNLLHLKSGRTKARFNLMDTSYYPDWTVFNPDGMIEAPDLGGRLAQVEWAASSNSADAPYNGVFFNGEFCVATDRYRLATVPLEIPGLERAVTVPGKILAPILPRQGDISIGIDEQQLLIMPDTHTQIRVVCFAQDYPKVERIMKRDYPQSVLTKKSALLEIMGRALNFAGSDRVPTMRVFLGKQEIAVMMSNTEIGLLGDVVETPGFCDHERVEYIFTPRNIMDALNASPNDEVTIGYSDSTSRGIVYINGGSGYEAWIAPRADGGGSAS